MEPAKRLRGAGVQRHRRKHRIRINYEYKTFQLTMRADRATARLIGRQARVILGQPDPGTEQEKSVPLPQPPVWLCLLVWRKVREMKPATLYRRAKVDRSNYYRYEQGKIVPSRETLERLAEALGLTLDQLLGRRPPEPHKPAAQEERAKKGDPLALLGLRLAELRRRAGLGIDDLARKAEVPARVILYAERGQEVPSVGDVRLLVAALIETFEAVGKRPERAAA